jgi:AraC family transcriptional regulator
MGKEIIHIKNMVCPRCIKAVEDILHNLHYPFEKIELGKAILKESLTKNQISLLKDTLLNQGFELLEDKKDKLVDRVKTIILQLIKNTNETHAEKLSSYLSKEIGHDYSHISSIFTVHEGITIEKFVILEKIEFVKELLSYDELTLSEIADKMNYSSLAALSAQFKSITGITPTKFKELKIQGRKSLDSINLFSFFIIHFYISSLSLLKSKKL